jgi:hypothetical protein
LGFGFLAEFSFVLPGFLRLLAVAVSGGMIAEENRRFESIFSRADLE